MDFDQKLLRALAKDLSLNDKGVGRLLGSVPVSTSTELGESQVAKRYDLGLRLHSKEILVKLSLASSYSQLEACIREYLNSCPHIINWIMRGDFNPQKLPENINNGQLLHASRTSGRLRASILRKL
ncbi:MAG: hypothetical protein R3A13_02240 [Bdellovibrionota bacterium]